MERDHAQGASAFDQATASTDGTAQIDPTKRYIDKSVVAEFWRHLEMFMEKNKPYLSF